MASTSIICDFSAYLPTFTVFLPFTKDYRRHDFTICSLIHPLAQRAMMMMTIIVLWVPYVAQTFYVQYLVLVNHFSLMSVAALKHLACMQEKTSTRV